MDDLKRAQLDLLEHCAETLTNAKRLPEAAQEILLEHAAETLTHANDLYRGRS